MKKKIIPVLIVVGLILIIAAGLILSALIKKYTPTKDRQDLTEYYDLSSEDQAAIILNYELLENKAAMIDQHIYLDYNFVHDEINSRFYWDANENILLYSTAEDIISVQADSTQYNISKSTKELDHTIVKASAESAWISIEFVKLYSDFTYSYLESPSRIVITNEWGEIEVATAKKDTQIRLRGGIKSPILTDVKKGTELTVLMQDEKWTEVATGDGIIGYIRSKQLSKTSTKELSSDFPKEEFSHILKDGEICLGWHQVTSRAANSDIANVLSSTKGINVISPTWFYLNDNNGNLMDLASTDYVNYCHQQNVDVWALVSNLENPDVDTTYVLTHTSIRQNLVNQIVSAAIQYNVDGINLDFEAISSSVGDAYIQFVRELSIKLANNGVILSVDNYVPSSYTAFYNRSEQANFADYVVIMGYDEHYAGGEEEGSVSSLNWVKEAVSNTLKEVPANQVILGMPFYTRVWTLTPDAESDSENASYSISSKAYGMKAAADLIEPYESDKIWLEDCGQYYVQFNKGDDICKVWLEDANSLEKRLQITDENQLAGAAFWKLGFETSDIWNTVIKYIN